MNLGCLLKDNQQQHQELHLMFIVMGIGCRILKRVLLREYQLVVINDRGLGEENLLEFYL